MSIPLGFIGCWLGTMLSSEPAAERKFDELYVRSETAIGAEGATGQARRRARPHRRGHRGDQHSTAAVTVTRAEGRGVRPSAFG